MSLGLLASFGSMSIPSPLPTALSRHLPKSSSPALPILTRPLAIYLDVSTDVSTSSQYTARRKSRNALDPNTQQGAYNSTGIKMLTRSLTILFAFHPMTTPAGSWIQPGVAHGLQTRPLLPPPQEHT